MGPDPLEGRSSGVAASTIITRSSMPRRSSETSSAEGIRSPTSLTTMMDSWEVDLVALVTRQSRATVIRARSDDNSNSLMSSLMTDSEDLVEASAVDSAEDLGLSEASVEA